MLFSVNGKSVWLIGDPHLGKKFEVGVPLYRRGERERSQMADFRKELDYDADVIIMVGDLFDHPYVAYSVVDEAARAVMSAAERNEDTTYIFMAGNHDLPRSITSVGAFHDFEDRVRDRFDNLYVVRTPQLISGIGVYPWEWDRTTAQQAVDDIGGIPEAAVGHWDLVRYGGSDNHLAPTKALHERFGHIPLYSGHFHTAGDYKVEGITVHCCGSLQPYSHGEDPDEEIYVTLPLAEALTRDDLADKAVRIILKQGEDLPEIDCMALTHIRERTVVDEGETQVSLATFDWNAILSKKLAPLHSEVRAFIKERLPSHESEEQH